MRYRGFITEPSTDEQEVVCHIFAAEDTKQQFSLDEIRLTLGEDISELSDRAILPHVIKHIDKNILDFLLLREEARNSILRQGLGRAVCFIGESQSGVELYDTLKDQIGLSDDEIRELGFKSLVPFFDKSSYAQTIAAYMTDEGTEQTESGNHHFSFTEINERFGTSLPGDHEMMDRIISALDSTIVADVDTTEDFDLTFHLDYCPYAESDAELDDLLAQYM